MSHPDQTYLPLLADSIVNGHYKADRTGVGSFSVFGRMAHFDLNGYKLPLLTTKKVFVRSLIHEMIWFISGDTNIRYLISNGVTIWNSWFIKGTDEYMPLSQTEMYGQLLRFFKVGKLDIQLVLPDQLNGQPYQFIPNEQGPAGGTLQLNIKHFPRDTEQFVRSAPHLKIAYHKVFNKEPLVMAAADIGAGGYGSQWRRWEDTRIVKTDEVEKFIERGYEKVFSIPKNSKWVKDKLGLGGGVVMHREIDQLANAIKMLSTSPEEHRSQNWNSRRIIVTAWNPGKIEDAALPPCHLYYQFFSRPMTLLELMERNNLGVNISSWVRGYMVGVQGDDVEVIHAGTPAEQRFRKGARDALAKLHSEAGLPVRKLKLLFLMRSNDLPIGAPFNIAQYGLLAHMVAQVTNHVAEELIYVGADAHIYADQVELAKTQCARAPLLDVNPTVTLNPAVKNIDDFTFSDITINGYEDGDYYPHIPYPVAV